LGNPRLGYAWGVHKLFHAWLHLGLPTYPEDFCCFNGVMMMLHAFASCLDLSFNW